MSPAYIAFSIGSDGVEPILMTMFVVLNTSAWEIVGYGERVRGGGGGLEYSEQRVLNDIDGQAFLPSHDSAPRPIPSPLSRQHLVSLT